MISNTGKSTGKNCPKCNGEILYNGNYFCEYWEDSCNWAMPHPQTELADKQLNFEFVGYWEEGEKVIDGELRWIIHRSEPVGE